MDIVAILAAIVSLAGAILTWVLTRASHALETRTQLREAYLRMMVYRSDHPEVLRSSRTYVPAVWTRIYGDDSDSRRKWVEYYTYLEHCLIYINLALASQELIPSVYRLQSEPLIRLLVSENYPAIRDILDDEYASWHLRNYVKTKQDAGWDWQRAHEQLPVSPYSDSTREPSSVTTVAN